MKRVLIFIAALASILSAGSAYGQGGSVVLWGDGALTTCNVVGSVGILTVYVTHELHPGAIAVQYALAENTGGALTYIADQNNFTLVTGDSQTGVAFSYGGCMQGQIHVQNVLYELSSNPAPCSQIEVVPDPSAPSGQIESVDCSAVKAFPSGERLTINGDGNCPCGHDPAAETSTWGRVKSLYR
jgi:hypothetical protein